MRARICSSDSRISRLGLLNSELTCAEEVANSFLLLNAWIDRARRLPGRRVVRHTMKALPLGQCVIAPTIQFAFYCSLLRSPHSSRRRTHNPRPFNRATQPRVQPNLQTFPSRLTF